MTNARFQARRLRGAIARKKQNGDRFTIVPLERALRKINAARSTAGDHGVYLTNIYQCFIDTECAWAARIK